MIKSTFAVIALLVINFVTAQEVKYTSLELNIPTSSATIKGTLLTPVSSNKNILVILIPGSGPTDRDGNNTAMKNNSLKFLAEALTEKNIATYRYDKSVLSIDKTQIDSLKFDTFVNEAKSVVNYFKEKNKYAKIIIAGHSQGSLVGIIASEKNVDGFISLAGAGRTIDQVIITQIEKQAPYLKEETIRIFADLKKGHTVDNVNPMLLSLFNKQVQPFIISWVKYSPTKEISKLKIPVLIINGTKDLQVPVNDAKLLHQAAVNSEIEIIENMNHLFKEIKGDASENMLSYNNPTIPVSVVLINRILTFVNKI
ncbi:alpha/beta hydrolase family protein [Lutibacter sp.]